MAALEKFFYVLQYYSSLQCFGTVGWQQEGHPVCKKMCVGLLVVTIWLELCTSYSSSCHHLIHHPCSTKVRTGGILVPGFPCCREKWLLNEYCCNISEQNGWNHRIENMTKFNNVDLCVVRQLKLTTTSYMHVQCRILKLTLLYCTIFSGVSSSLEVSARTDSSSPISCSKPQQRQLLIHHKYLV